MHTGAPLNDVLSRVHPPVVVQGEPSADNPINKPYAHNRHREPRHEETDAERRDNEEHAQAYPKQAEPERADLPSEVRFEPGAAHVTPLHVVENHCDDRRPSCEEGANDRRGTEDAGQQAERVQRVDDLRPAFE